VSNEKPSDEDNIHSERVYEGALSSASRLSQLDSRKANGADFDLVSGVEMMSPQKKGQPDKNRDGDHLNSN